MGKHTDNGLGHSFGALECVQNDIGLDVPLDGVGQQPAATVQLLNLFALVLDEQSLEAAQLLLLTNRGCRITMGKWDASW